MNVEKEKITTDFEDASNTIEALRSKVLVAIKSVLFFITASKQVLNNETNLGIKFKNVTDYNDFF